MIRFILAPFIKGMIKYLEELEIFEVDYFIYYKYSVFHPKRSNTVIGLCGVASALYGDLIGSIIMSYLKKHRPSTLNIGYPVFWWPSLRYKKSKEQLNELIQVRINFLKEILK